MSQIDDLGAVVAHSMGALAASTVAADQGRCVPIAMIAPVVRLGAFAEAFAAHLGVDRNAQDAVLAAIEQRSALKLHDLDLRMVAPRVRGPSLLVLDERDRLVPLVDARQLVPLVDARQLVPCFGDVRALELDAGGHYRCLRSPEAVSAVVDFIHGALRGQIAA